MTGTKRQWKSKVNTPCVRTQRTTAEEGKRRLYRLLSTAVATPAATKNVSHSAREVRTLLKSKTTSCARPETTKQARTAKDLEAPHASRGWYTPSRNASDTGAFHLPAQNWAMDVEAKGARKTAAAGTPQHARTADVAQRAMFAPEKRMSMAYASTAQLERSESTASSHGAATVATTRKAALRVRWVRKETGG